MSTLPQDYSEFKSVWESVSVVDRNLDNLVERLRLIEMRLPSKLVNSGQDAVALAVNKQRKHAVKWKGLKCFICGEGHFASKCPKKKCLNEKKSKDKPHSNNTSLFCLSTVNLKQPSSTTWFADTGATNHMCNSQNLFVNYKNFDQPITVTVGNKEAIQAVGRGDIKVKAFVGKKIFHKVLESVWFVPGLAYNLLSVGQTTDKGIEFKANSKGCVFLKENRPMLFGKRLGEGSLYELKMEVECGQAHLSSISSSKLSLQEWHERLVHQNKAHVARILQQKNMQVNGSVDFCEACMYGKQRRKSFHVRHNRP